MVRWAIGSIFAQPAHESTRLPVRAAVFVKSGQAFKQRRNKIFAEFSGRPVFEFAKIEDMPYYREMCVHVGPNEYVSADNSHSSCPVLFGGGLPRLNIIAPARDQNMQLDPYQADGLPAASLVH